MLMLQLAHLVRRGGWLCRDSEGFLHHIRFMLRNGLQVCEFDDARNIMKWIQEPPSEGLLKHQASLLPLTSLLILMLLLLTGITFSEFGPLCSSNC